MQLRRSGNWSTARGVSDGEQKSTWWEGFMKQEGFELGVKER